MTTVNKKTLEKIGILYFIFLLPMLAIQFNLDNDTYWIIKTGEYICSNWLPQTDFLTMHTDMELVIQQWLSDVIFYNAYKILGIAGPIILAYCIYVLFAGLFYKLSLTITQNKIFAITAVFIGSLYIAKYYIVTRPQIFTYCIILIQLLALEKYVKTGKINHLAVLPVLSVLLVNLHASMWTMLFLIMLPYIVNSLPVKIKGKSLSCCKTLPLLAVTVLMALCGLATPYGYKGLAFIFTTSIGDKVNSSINELAPLTLSLTSFGLLQFAIVALVAAVYIIHKKGKTELRFILLTVGTGIMAFLYIKLVPYFIIAAYPAALRYLDDIKIDLNKLPKRKNSKISPKTTKLSIVIILVCIVVLMATVVIQNVSNAVEYVKTDGENSYTRQLDEALDAIEKDAEKHNTEIVLYNGFNSGAYLEFKGYTTYIDPRADSFVVEANNDYDYLTEYFDFKNGDVYYEDIIEKYGFTYLIVESPGENTLKTNLSNDDDYKIIYEDEKITAFKKA